MGEACWRGTSTTHRHEKQSLLRALRAPVPSRHSRLRLANSEVPASGGARHTGGARALNSARPVVHACRTRADNGRRHVIEQMRTRAGYGCALACRTSRAVTTTGRATGALAAGL